MRNPLVVLPCEAVAPAWEEPAKHFVLTGFTAPIAGRGF